MKHINKRDVFYLCNLITWIKSYSLWLHIEYVFIIYHAVACQLPKFLAGNCGKRCQHKGNAIELTNQAAILSTPLHLARKPLNALY